MATALKKISELIHAPLMEMPECLKQRLKDRHLKAMETLASTMNEIRISTLDQVQMVENALVFRLSLYEMVLDSDKHKLPDLVLKEIRTNQLYCLTILMHFHLIMGNHSAAAALGLQLLERVAEIKDELRTFVEEQIAGLLVTLDPEIDQALVRELATRTIKAGMAQDFALLAQSRCNGGKPRPDTISQMVQLTRSKRCEIAAAAHYLLAQIYNESRLPLEEMKQYVDWKSSLEKYGGKCAVAIAASITDQPEARSAILQGIERLISLKAANNEESLDLVKELQQWGFGDVAEAWTGSTMKKQGWTCYVKHQGLLIQDAENIELLYSILTGCKTSHACIIIQGDGAGRGVVFRKDQNTTNATQYILQELTLKVELGLFIHDRIMNDEESFGPMKWILVGKGPLEGIGIGITELMQEFSVCLTNAVILETKLTDKDEKWRQKALAAMRMRADQQTIESLNKEIAAIAGKIGPSTAPVEIIKI